MYFIRWVEAGRLHAVRQVGLTGVIQQFEGGLPVDGRLRRATLARDLEAPSPGAQRGMEDS